MRISLYCFALLLSGSLSAQIYQQNAPPVQQVQAAVDCYNRNLDQGNAALRRGEARAALRFFTDAKSCPDVQGNARRISELDSRIERCEEQLGTAKKPEQGEKALDVALPSSQKRSFSNELPKSRKGYPANPVFLKDTLDDCFERMVNEANRAFNLKFWEDAAALYRAAKNCANADQNDRLKMSERITSCRNAAENELFAKQQEAERQARHAIAANLADDAQELLRSTDRTLAFRLADFANQYIAPDDNPDCVQAMFDAWYYQPSESIKDQSEALYRPVFCYELVDNLGENTQIKFQQQKDGTQWLWAFVPKNGDMFAWEMPSMKMIQAYGAGEVNGYKGFDFAPNGDLLFWGDNFFDLRRGANSVRIKVSAITNYCFSTRGDEFFYENAAEEKIMVLNVKEAFSHQFSRKGSKNANIVQLPSVPREIVSGVPKGLLALQYLDGKFWMGYKDRIEILSKPGAGKPWQREKIIRFEGVALSESIEQKELHLKLFPLEGFAILSSPQGSWTIPLGTNPENSATETQARSFNDILALAISPSGRQIAGQYFGNYSYNGFWVLDALTGDTLHRQRIPSQLNYEFLKGSFSADNQWIAAVNYTGNLSVWALQDAPTIWSAQLPYIASDKSLFSPEGNRLFVPVKDTLAIFNTSSTQKPEFLWKTFGQALIGASSHWALIQVSSDSAEAIRLDDGHKIRFLLHNEGEPLLYAFDSKGQNLVAYLSAWNKVEVRSLKTGAVVGSRVFDGGGPIGSLQFIPESDQLMVVQSTPMGESLFGQSSVKVWSPLQTGEKPRALRLHEYPVRTTAVDDSGKMAALSNGNDIRVFDLKNIENEILKIRAAADDYVQSISFRPNTNLLAAAYSTGKVVFWDLSTGQAAFQLQIISKQTSFNHSVEISTIEFSHSGSVLQIATTDGRLLAYALDPSYIRTVAQDANRPLQSFSADYIVRYSLEAALYYPGNFERLAESGDAPLVRSFFQHFMTQAGESNNIVQVRNYCERAFYLYDRLDENTKGIWRSDMSFMYEEYARKLILRGNIKEASAIVNFIKQEFNTESTLLNAHVALLSRNFPVATALYSKYFLINEFDGKPLSFGSQYHFEFVEKSMVQLRDFELLDSIQSSCFCGTVRLSGAFTNFCPNGQNYPDNFVSAADRLHWEIAQNRNAAEFTLRHATKVNLLETALQKAKTLVQQNPKKERIWLETIGLELAIAHQKWGIFEQNSPDAYVHFEKAVQYLTELGPLLQQPDTSRLAQLTATRFLWGRQLLEAGKPREALAQLRLSLETAQPLSELVYNADTSLLVIYYDNLIGPIYEKIGTAYLNLGETELAKTAYERSNTYFVTYGLNSLYNGNVAVLENDSITAFLAYGGISDVTQAATAFYGISRLIEWFPEKRKTIEALGQRLRTTLKSKNPRLVNIETDYWFARLQTAHFAALSKWDSALEWSTIAMKNAKRMSEQSNSDETWTGLWLDEHINLPYYLLLKDWKNPAALAECIRYVEEAEAFLATKEASNFYYGNRELLKTNLAHALMLRNQSGDRAQAIALYKQFMQSYADPRGYDNLDLLQKDLRDLQRLGALFPPLPELEEIAPD